LILSIAEAKTFTAGLASVNVPPGGEFDADTIQLEDEVGLQLFLLGRRRRVILTELANICSTGQER